MSLQRDMIINDTSVIALFIEEMTPDHKDFQDSLLRYQGKESVLFPASHQMPEELSISLDNYFTTHNGITTERARDLPLVKKGDSASIREGASRGLMLKALYRLNLSMYYEDVTKLCVEYWGWKPPILTPKMEQQILVDFDYTYELYHRHINPTGPPKG